MHGDTCQNFSPTLSTMEHCRIHTRIHTTSCTTQTQSINCPTQTSCLSARTTEIINKTMEEIDKETRLCRRREIQRSNLKLKRAQLKYNQIFLESTQQQFFEAQKISFWDGDKDSREWQKWCYPVLSHMWNISVWGKQHTQNNRGDCSTKGVLSLFSSWWMSN